MHNNMRMDFLNQSKSRFSKMTFPKILFFLSLTLSTFLNAALAATVVIGPGDSLQTAIDNASAGDTILLKAGTYKGNPIIVNKPLLIAGKPYFDTRDKLKIGDVILNASDGSAIRAFVTKNSSGKVTILGMKFIGGENTLSNLLGNLEVGYCLFEGDESTTDIFSFEFDGYGEVHHCEFRNAGDDAIDVDSKSLTAGAFIRIHDNVIEGTRDDGIEIRFYARGNSQPLLVYDIHHNRFKGATSGTGDAIQLIDQDASENSRRINIFRNVIDGNDLIEVGIGCLDNAQTSEDFAGADGMNEAVYIYNNTILNTREYGITGGDHTFVINNIIMNTPRGIKHVANEGKVDYTLTYNTPSGAMIDVVDGGNNYLDQDPGLNQVTYELNSDSFCIGKGIKTYIDSALPAPIFVLADFRCAAPSLGAIERFAASHDILWRNRTSGNNLVWRMDDMIRTSEITLAPFPNLNWEIHGTGDFDNDCETDILWRNKSSGNNQVWLMDGTTRTSGVYLAPFANLNWEIGGTGDFNNDGKTDILWRNKTSGKNQVWLMDGRTLISGAYLAPFANLDWQIGGTGDFNNDGKTDILWRNKKSGNNQVWLMDGTTRTSMVTLAPFANLDWEIGGTGDFNNDGKTDILWRNRISGNNQVWLMDGTTRISGVYLAPFVNLDWEIGGVIK